MHLIFMLFFIFNLHRLQFLLYSLLSSSYYLYSLVKQLSATGRPDEKISIEVNGPLFFGRNEVIQDESLLSIFLQKGQLKSNICYHPESLTNLEVLCYVFVFFLLTVFVEHSKICRGYLNSDIFLILSSGCKGSEFATR
jgi:hypothetical protein